MTTAVPPGVYCGAFDYPDYLATPEGRVWSLISRRFLKPIAMGNYRGLQLKGRDGATKHCYVHRLVLEAFDGPCPPGMEARHLNGINTDNRHANLRWGTPVENAADKLAHGTSSRGEGNGQSKLTDALVAEIRQRAASGELQYVIAAELGVSKMTISRAVRRESWADAS